MGDAADDAFDAALREQATTQAMHDAGCRRCTACPKDGVHDCLVCFDFGWINSNGEPCEP